MSGRREYPPYTISAVFTLMLVVSFAILTEPQRGSPVSRWPQIKWKSPVSNIMVLSPDKAQTNESSFEDCLLGASASTGMSGKGGTDSCTFWFLIIHCNKYVQGCFSAGTWDVGAGPELILSQDEVTALPVPQSTVGTGLYTSNYKSVQGSLPAGSPEEAP